LSQRLHDPEASPYGPLGIIFVCQGIAEVDEQAIAKILRNMPLKAGDHLGTGLLIGPHHRAQLFRVELAGERGRVHQVTEHDRELAAFGVGERRCRVCGFKRGALCSLRAWWRGVLRRESSRLRHRSLCTDPDQDCTILIHRAPLSLNEFNLQVLERLVIKLELPLEEVVGHAAPLS